MKPRKLKLAGFAGIASGQGKDEVYLDLTTIVPAEAMIVAVAGPNGSGKTTLMDNLHPYRVMPSRSSTPTPTAFSYYDHIVNGEGLKELEWEHEGRVFKSSIRIRATAKTKKQEAYLFEIVNDVEQPYQDAASGLMSDGKADTYDQCVEQILGKPEVFFATQFSAQGKKPIGSLTASEVKSLIAEMLDMSKLKALSAKAAAVNKGLKPALEQTSQEMMRLQSSMSDVAQIDLRLESIIAEKTRLSAELQSSNQLIAKLKVDNEQLETSLAQQAAIEAQHDALNHRLELTRREVATAAQALADQHRLQESQLRQQLQSFKAAADIAKAHRDRQVASYREAMALMGQKDALAQAKKQKADLCDLKRAKENEIAELSLDVHRLAQIRQEVSALNTELATMTQSGSSMAHILAQIQQTASLLNEVPCQGTEMSGRCKLLTQANEAAKTVSVKTVELKNLRDGYRTKKGNAEIMERQLAHLESSELKSRQLQSEINTIQSQLDALQPILMQAQSIDAAQTTIETITREGEKSKADLLAAQESLDQLQAQMDQLAAKQAVELAKQQADGQRLIQEIESSKALLPPLLSATSKDALATQMSEAMSKLQSTQKMMDALDIEADTLKAQKAQAHLMAQSIDRLKAKADRLTREIAHWTLLTKALGTDGIIAMSIDDAGPHVSSIANQLLKDCYGGRFVLSLLTQAETASGAQKEVFRIQVEDTLRGETKLLDDMSGGEKVWINECLVRALSLYMTQSGGRQVSTLFSDESDGALDPDRKRQYMAMKRAVLKQGGYDQEFLITQTPELLTMCDAVIDVTKL